jgi:ketosteroid isomerase-like protein
MHDSAVNAGSAGGGVKAAIETLIFEYAAGVDAGDFARVAKLFANATYRAAAGDQIAVFKGAEQVQKCFEGMVIRHEDGTPSTKHVTTNVTVDADGDTASAKSYFSVLQARPELPLQVIVAGRYEDRFERAGGEWRFTDRLILTDLVGNLKYHLTTAPF